MALALFTVVIEVLAGPSCETRIRSDTFRNVDTSSSSPIGGVRKWRAPRCRDCRSVWLSVLIVTIGNFGYWTLNCEIIINDLARSLSRATSTRSGVDCWITSKKYSYFAHSASSQTKSTPNSKVRSDSRLASFGSTMAIRCIFFSIWGDPTPGFSSRVSGRLPLSYFRRYSLNARIVVRSASAGYWVKHPDHRRREPMAHPEVDSVVYRSTWATGSAGSPASPAIPAAARHWAATAVYFRSPTGRSWEHIAPSAAGRPTTVRATVQPAREFGRCGIIFPGCLVMKIPRPLEHIPLSSRHFQHGFEVQLEIVRSAAIPAPAAVSEPDCSPSGQPGAV